jgi:UDP-glucose 4-epimerase
MDSRSSLDRFAGKRIFVTGASGFIGAHLCRRLSTYGAEVHAISRRRHVAAKDGYRWWQGDLSEAKTVREIVRTIRPDVIFHLAAQVDGSRELAIVPSMLLSNLVATVNLLCSAAEAGCPRIILTGSLEEPMPGCTEAMPCSPYAASKWAGNAYGRMFHSLYQLPVVILRLFMVYGPAQPDERKLIPYVIRSLLRGEAPKIASGRRPVDWIYIDDVVEAFIRAALVANVEGHTFEIGSGELVTVRSVVELIVQNIDPSIQPQFGALPDRKREQVRAADLGESQSVLGWKPVVALGQGLARTTEWYRNCVKGIRPRQAEVATAATSVLLLTKQCVEQ